MFMEGVRLCYLWIGFPINMFELIHFRTIDSYGQKEMQMTENKLGKQPFLSKLQHTHTHTHTLSSANFSKAPH